MGDVKDQVMTDRYVLYNGDCIPIMKKFPDASIHAAIYSLPFARPGTANPGLYHYSSSDHDLSNSRTYEEFMAHYEFAVDQIARLMMPGRICGVHCMDVPAGNSGGDALSDFPGDLIRLHLGRGFDYVGRHSIWKEPLAVRNRTMIKDLTHKTVVDDAALAGIASGDYLLIFRRHGTNPVPVVHPNGLTAYHGASSPPADVLRYRNWPGDQIQNRYSQWVWRQYASCIWDDIRGNLGQWDKKPGQPGYVPPVLPYKEGRDEEDEQHLHALQKDVVLRFVDMRTNPGETVLSPFAGVGSEIFGAVELGRRGLGIELKPSYFRQAVKNLADLSTPPMAEQETLL